MWGEVRRVDRSAAYRSLAESRDTRPETSSMREDVELPTCGWWEEEDEERTCDRDCELMPLLDVCC